MFLRNHLFNLFCKFLWWGLALGLFYAVCKLIMKASKRNVYVCNIVSFCFWLIFGMIFSALCINFYNYQFCWFGLAGMGLGLVLVKFSIEFFFTNFVRLLYNKFTKQKARKVHNGELRRS